MLSLWGAWWADHRLAVTSYLRRSDSLVDVATVTGAAVVVLVGAVWQGSQHDPDVPAAAGPDVVLVPGDETATDLGERPAGASSMTGGSRSQPDGDADGSDGDGEPGEDGEPGPAGSGPGATPTTEQDTTGGGTTAPSGGGGAGSGGSGGSGGSSAPAPTDPGTTSPTSSPTTDPPATTDPPPTTTVPPTTTTQSTTTTTSTESALGGLLPEL